MRAVVYTHAAIVVAFVSVGLAEMYGLAEIYGLPTQSFVRLATVVVLAALMAFFLCPILLLGMLVYGKPGERRRWAILAEVGVCVTQLIALLPAIH
ncbi:MAG: hypothetical protein Q8K78_01485 [Planctomycetaceae bacterium]|nr:hypothetical protein [Planctomycetaceae bacterium]